MQKQYLRNHVDYLLLICIFCMFALFTSCEKPPEVTATAIGGTTGGGTTGGGAGSITLSLSQGTVQSDNSDFTTITASVMDANNVPMNGTLVTFSSPAGAISAATGTTDATSPQTDQTCHSEERSDEESRPINQERDASLRSA